MTLQNQNSIYSCGRPKHERLQLSYLLSYIVKLSPRCLTKQIGYYFEHYVAIPLSISTFYFYLTNVNIIVIHIHVNSCHRHGQLFPRLRPQTKCFILCTKTTPHRTFSCTLHLKPSKRWLLSLGDESLTFSLEGEFPTAKATVFPTAIDAERKRLRIPTLVDAALMED